MNFLSKKWGIVAGVIAFSISLSSAWAQLPPYPLDLAQTLLGARIRLDTTTGVHLPNNFPLPLTGAGTADASLLLGDSFDGLEFDVGAHILTITLPSPQVVSRVAFLNQTVEGSFTVLLSGSDPQLLAHATPVRPETPISGPQQLNSALFKPQLASFIQVSFLVRKAGRIAHLAVYGEGSDLDYVLQTPEDPAPLLSASGASKPIEVNVAALSAGARVSGISSTPPGFDPETLLSDAFGSGYLFATSDSAPTMDIDFHAMRWVNRVSVLLSTPPSRVDLIKIAAPLPTTAPTTENSIGTVTHLHGTVEFLNFDGTGRHPAKEGDPFQAGQVLNTGYDSLAEFEIDGTSLVRFGSNSNVTFRKGVGTKLSLLRGALLWQVFGAGGGGDLDTPTQVAAVHGGIVLAEASVKGSSSLRLLQADGGQTIPLRDTVTGEFCEIQPGQEVSAVAGTRLPLALAPFDVMGEWKGNPLCSAAGPLRLGAEKRIGAPPPQEEVIATTTTAGLTEARLLFQSQPLPGIRVRITPLGTPSPYAPAVVAVVKVQAFGTYPPQGVSLQPKPRVVPPTPVQTAVPAPTPAPAVALSASAPIPAQAIAPALPASRPVLTSAPAPPPTLSGPIILRAIPVQPIAPVGRLPAPKPVKELPGPVVLTPSALLFEPPPSTPDQSTLPPSAPPLTPPPVSSRVPTPAPAPNPAPVTQSLPPLGPAIPPPISNEISGVPQIQTDPATPTPSSSAFTP